MSMILIEFRSLANLESQRSCREELQTMSIQTVLVLCVYRTSLHVDQLNPQILVDIQTTLLVMYH